MKAAIYARVSTEDQEREGTSLKSQLEACKKLAHEKGYQTSDEYIIHEVYSGLTLDRPNLARLRDWLQNGEINAVVIYSSDRFSRDGYDFLTLIRDCKKAGVELLCVTEPLQDGQVGELLSYVRGWASKLEAEKIKERTMRGKRERAKNGKLPQGTGRGAFGYHYDPATGRRTIVETEAKVVRRIFDMASEGYSFHGIAQLLNKEGILTFAGHRWHPLTVKRMLTNPIYAGITYYGRTKRISSKGRTQHPEQRDPSDWIEVPNATPPIISKTEFQAVHDALVSPRRRISQAPQHYLLTGHIFCGYCGGPMCGSILRRRYRYYYCRRTHPDYAFPTRCEAKYVPADKAEETVWHEVLSILQRPDIILAEIKRQRESTNDPTDDELDRVEKEIQSQRDWEYHLLMLARDRVFDDNFILREARRTKEKKQTLEQEKKQLYHQKQALLNLEQSEVMIKEFCQKLSHKLTNLTLDEKRLALDALQVKVIAYHDHLDLRGVLPTYVTIARTSA